MTEYLTEQEQVELLKKWIKQYSLVVLAGVMVAIALISGWRYWQQSQNTLLINASSVYDEMLTTRAQNNFTDATLQAKQIQTQYSKTVYAEMAALMQAKMAINNNDYDAAVKSLRRVIAKSNIPAIRQIARIRLARILTQLKKPDEALTLLQTVDDKAFNGLTKEVAGDAYYAMQNYSEARTAYGAAIALLPNAEAARPVLQMKYDNLASNADLTRVHSSTSP